MIKQDNSHLLESVAELSQRSTDGRDDLRGRFDAEIRLPTGLSREFLSAAILSAIENKVDLGLFHDADCTVIAHFGGDEIFLPSRWWDKRWHIGLEDSDRFDPAD